MIPNTIHYCWFGRNPKPKLAEKCIKSWKKYCPDYEIIEWNEDNFDIASAPLYVRQAYEAKKWAFVTDYVRLWAMTKYGGIYMDTDVEVVKPLDQFLNHDAVSGFQSQTEIQTGLMACREGFPLFLELLGEYDTLSFVNENGTYDLTPNVDRITQLCSQYGFEANGEFQIVEGFALYPVEYFCPLDWNTKVLNKTKNTHAIHWFSASWWDEQTRKNHQAYLKEKRRKRICYFPNKCAKKILGEKVYHKLKILIKGES